MIKSNPNSTPPQTTFDREMTDPDFKEQFEKEYQEFALTEIVHQFREQENLSIGE